jgi:hypothetical protein
MIKIQFCVEILSFIHLIFFLIWYFTDLSGLWLYALFVRLVFYASKHIGILQVISILTASAPLFLRNGELLGHSPIHNVS